MYKYEIVNNGKDEILYLYLDMRYEFSKELIRDDYKSLSKRTLNFINTNKINFKGNKVYLIVNGIVVKSVDITEAINKKYSNDYSPDKFKVKVEQYDGSFSIYTLRDYLLIQLFSYNSFNLHTEVYKSICVLFNTYAYNMMKINGYIPYNDLFSSYNTINEYKQLISNYNEVIDNYNSIINDSNSLFLSFDNEYILPFIHYSNSGYTLANKKYPYLSSVKCLWDLASPQYIKYHDYNYDYLQNLLKTNITNKSKIIINKNNDNKKIYIDNKIFNYEEFRKLLCIDSSEFYLIVYSNYLRIISCGHGNSYGLSLFSANEIAKNGANFSSILSYFFPKTKLYKYTKKEH
jgi:stage II sporulation protein D